jgi:ankyrin repeat protein
MDRSVTRILPLLLLLLSCQREQDFSPKELSDRERHAEAVQKERATAEAAEAAIRNRCQSSETVITLRRTPGYTTPGFFVSYDLAICGDGTVTYRGDGCVRIKGTQRAKIDPAEVQRLVQAFLDADYFRMTDHPPGIDASGAYTSLSLGQRHKMVMDQEDRGSQKLKQLEDMIDKVAGPDRWVNIDAAEVKDKTRQGWDIRSPEAGLLLLKAAVAGDADTVRAFIERGANVNAKVDVDAWRGCLPGRRISNPWQSVAPLQRARGVEVVKLLIDAGANVNPKAAFEAPLQFQVEVGDADSVKALVEAGANTEAGSSPNGWTALMWAAYKPNPAVVGALLRGGAKVNAKDDSGRTALDMVPRFSLPDVMPGYLDDVERNQLSAEEERMRLSAAEVERMLLSAGAVSGHPAN